MQIKKFEAESFSVAMEKVKKELGAHALILKSQTLEKFGKPGKRRVGQRRVEITAAVEHSKPNENTVALEDPQEEEAGFFHNYLEDREIKSVLYTLLSQTDRARALGLKEYQLDLYKELIEGGISESMVAKMFRRLNSSKYQIKTRSVVTDKKIICGFMKRAICCPGPIKTQKGYPKVVALVGPTGVGKTTTLAKLAAHYAIKEQKKIAMVSLDTYRIGAVDQLRVYGDIMQVPVEGAEDICQYRKALNRHADKDLIFVDTTGKSVKDPSYAECLKKILRQSGPVEIHLTLSASLQERIWDKAHRQFAPLKIDRALITKCDEGLSFGSLFNYSLQTRIPYSYFTMGQRVPEDIEVATSERVIRLIFNENKARLGD